MLASGLAAACALAGDLTVMDGVRNLRDCFWASLQARFGDRVVLNGHPERRLPNTLNVSFVGRIGADVLAAIEGVAASTGSACHSGRIELSSVLAAMGVAPAIGNGAVRFSLGRATRSEEILEVVERLSSVLSQDL
jgi:cysteine desulfurase